MSVHIIVHFDREYWRVKRVTETSSKEEADKEVEKLELEGRTIQSLCDISDPSSLFELGVSMGEYSQDEKSKIRTILRNHNE